MKIVFLCMYSLLVDRFSRDKTTSQVWAMCFVCYLSANYSKWKPWVNVIASLHMAMIQVTEGVI